MVWSLSKDDDGLDSVLPLADDASVQPPEQVPFLANYPPTPPVPRAVVAEHHFRGPSVAPSSVVVDPSSQVPEPLGSDSRRRRPVEATLILTGRKMDKLRAEVARQQLAQRRKKLRTLILWAAAGALALCLGWLAGLVFSPRQELASDESAPAAAASGTSPAAPLPTSVELKPSETPVSSPVAERQGGPSPLASSAPPVLTLEAVPEEEEPVAVPSQGGKEDEGEAFTLDDLPLD